MKKYVDIDVDKLPFPDGIGNNGEDDIRDIPHGCAVCKFLLNNGLSEPLNFEYILRESSKDSNMLQLCMSSSHCKKLYDKFISGEYKALYNGGQGRDDIEVGFFNGGYTIFEGKHRVCVAKRFGIKTLPVILEVLDD